MHDAEELWTRDRLTSLLCGPVAVELGRNCSPPSWPCESTVINQLQVQSAGDLTLPSLQMAYVIYLVEFKVLIECLAVSCEVYAAAWRLYPMWTICLPPKAAAQPSTIHHLWDGALNAAVISDCVRA